MTFEEEERELQNKFEKLASMPRAVYIKRGVHEGKGVCPFIVMPVKDGKYVFIFHTGVDYILAQYTSQKPPRAKSDLTKMFYEANGHLHKIPMAEPLLMYAVLLHAENNADYMQF